MNTEIWQRDGLGNFLPQYEQERFLHKQAIAVVNSAHLQRPELFTTRSSMPLEAQLNLVKKILGNMHLLTNLAEKSVTPEELSESKIIFTFSNSGSTRYEVLPTDNSAYLNNETYLWSDRKRLMYAAELGTMIADYRKRDKNTKFKGAEYPQIIYNGPPQQNQHLMLDLMERKFPYPADKVTVIDPKVPFVRTIDQVQRENFLPYECLASMPGKEVVVVAHDFHTERIRRMIPLTDVLYGHPMRVCPVRTEGAGWWQSMSMEAQGTLIYTLKGQCSVEPYPIINPLNTDLSPSWLRGFDGR